MASRKTHYDVLGIGRDASSVEIASAFRDKLAEAKAKPDTPPEAILAVREAYQTLANPAQRDAYDESIAPVASARATRAARQPARTADDDEPGGFFSSRLALIGIPLVVVVIAVWGWKQRHKPPPDARIVSVVRMEASSQSPPTSRGEEARGPGIVPAASVAVSASAEGLFASASPSIVRVLVADARGRPVSQGSGVVIGPGQVITNCHVTKGGSTVTVKSASGVLPASVSVADEEFDLCSLDVSRLDAPASTVGSVVGLRTGQRVYAIGAPMGLDLTISEGIVSSLRDVGTGTVIQTTAPVSPGSSGGGLFTADGQLVGIVTYQHRYGQNLNFAVPADWIAEMRARTASSSPPQRTTVASHEPTTAEMVVGKWHCFGSISGRNGEYTYRNDGTLQVVSTDGRNFAAPYRVVGRSIQYVANGQAFALEIESIARDRMVQFVSAGQRLACDRSE